MSTPPAPQIERRKQSRRSVDRPDDLLNKTFSTPLFHSFLEQMTDGVLLLDKETRTIYATPSIVQLIKRPDTPLVLLPKFTLTNPNLAAQFSAFVNQKNQTADSLVIRLEDKINGLLLLNCFQFQNSDEPGLRIARYVVTLRYANSFNSHQWQLFKKQYHLTPAEVRLCSSLADGLTLNHYCRIWKVAVSTARSQLHTVFGKTFTRRQSDLLRLIFLFSRT